MSDKETKTMDLAQKREAVALVECLAYLQQVATNAGFMMVAHMIDLAKGATNELIHPNAGTLPSETGATSHADFKVTEIGQRGLSKRTLQ